MLWQVDVTADFEQWFDSLNPSEKEDVRAGIKLLREFGPRLGRPYADTLKGSRHSNMKELRVQSGGKPLRALFAFNPLRTAIVLIGGDKSEDQRFYERMIPLADDLYDDHLRELKQKGAP